MKTLYEDVIHETEAKKSRFITYLHKCASEEDAKDFIKQIKKLHPSATHHCTALKIGDILRSNDDGEPSGTAGHPMLDVLIHEDMDEIAAVVVRYFGGTLLGKGGLIRAYSSGVKEALNKATLCENQELDQYVVEFDYAYTGKIDSYLRNKHIEADEADYQEKVSYVLSLNYDPSSDLMELCSGNITIEHLGKITKQAVISSHD